MGEEAGESGCGLHAGASHTDWSMIRRAVREPGGSALDRLSQRYWPAIYAYCRSLGLRPEEASDATQGFMCDIVLERGLLEVADPHRGRFRSLLLSSLRNYVRDRQRRATRRRRAPIQGAPASLGALPFDPAAANGRTPDQAFTAQWAATLVREVLDQVRTECLASGQSDHWTIFESRVARPMLLGAAPASYADLAARLGIDDVSRAANMLVTVKRRVAAALRAAVSRTVDSPEDVDDEIRELMRHLEVPG